MGLVTSSDSERRRGVDVFDLTHVLLGLVAGQIGAVKRTKALFA